MPLFRLIFDFRGQIGLKGRCSTNWATSSQFDRSLKTTTRSAALWFAPGHGYGAGKGASRTCLPLFSVCVKSQQRIPSLRA